METVFEIKNVVANVEKELPTLKTVNPVQHDIIQGSLQNIQRVFGCCQGLFDENLINLYKLGFKNEKRVKAFYESVVYTGFLTFYDTYTKVIEDFGESSILLPFGQFTRILDDYGLISGPLDNYTGEIPNHVVNAILDANNKWPSYLGSLHAIRKVSLNDGYDLLEKNINRFPFYSGKKEYAYHGYSVSCDSIEKFCEFYGKSSISAVETWETEEIDGHLFIAAPVPDMEPVKKIEVLPQQKKDPLVCSFVPYVGIVVHTSWGPEGKDVVLNLYKLLSKILAKIGENEIIHTIFDECNYEIYKPSKMPFSFDSEF